LELYVDEKAADPTKRRARSVASNTEVFVTIGDAMTLYHSISLRPSFIVVGPVAVAIKLPSSRRVIVSLLMGHISTWKKTHTPVMVVKWDL